MKWVKFHRKLLILTATIFAMAFTYQNCGVFESADDSFALNFSASDEEAGFICEPGDLPRPTDARRLTKIQYENTLKSLIRGLSVAELNNLLPVIFKTPVPNDGEASFQRTDNNLTASHTRAYFDTASSFASLLSEDLSRLERFGSHYIALKPGRCDQLNFSSLNSNCSRVFIENFGMRVLRRPLLEKEVDDLVATYVSKNDIKSSFSAVIFRLLMHPSFLLKIENAGDNLSTNVVRLSPYELASRLSYQFWDTMPDERLFAVAESGAVLITDEYRKIVEWVANDPKARATFEKFYYTWLGIKKIPDFIGVDSPAYRHLAGTVKFDNNLKEAMKKELIDLTSLLTWESKGTLEELFTSNVSVTQNLELLKLYGMSAPAAVLPASQRAGILTRAGLLSNGAPMEHPIHRGIHIMKDYLCEPILAPDSLDLPADALQPPALNENLTTRERYEEKTSGGTCQKCHVSINGFGFGLTSYNGLAQFRTVEAIFNEQGTFIKNLPVTSKVDLPSFGRGVSAANPVEYSKLVGRSIKAQKCFSRKYYEFSFSRPGSDTLDGCALANIRLTVGKGGTLKDIFKSIAFENSFLFRTIGDE